MGIVETAARDGSRLFGPHAPLARPLRMAAPGERRMSPSLPGPAPGKSLQSVPTWFSRFSRRIRAFVPSSSHVAIFRQLQRVRPHLRHWRRSCAVQGLRQPIVAVVLDALALATTGGGAMTKVHVRCSRCGFQGFAEPRECAAGSPSPTRQSSARAAAPSNGVRASGARVRASSAAGDSRRIGSLAASPPPTLHIGRSHAPDERTS